MDFIKFEIFEFASDVMGFERSELSIAHRIIYYNHGEFVRLVRKSLAI